LFVIDSIENVGLVGYRRKRKHGTECGKLGWQSKRRDWSARGGGRGCGLGWRGIEVKRKDLIGALENVRIVEGVGAGFIGISPS